MLTTKVFNVHKKLFMACTYRRIGNYDLVHSRYFGPELPAESLYNYGVSDISKAIENDNAEAATKT